MSKIFRLHTGGTEDISHWTEINGHLNDTQINTITDPSNATAHSQITSIPSPFARMDLVRTAFSYINATRQLEGTTIYHKIVSDCWDIAELFFNIEALGNKIELIEWRSGIRTNGGELTIDPESDLGNMMGSASPKHRLLAETLQMFLFQDERSFNFARLDGIYMLNYKHGPDPINIIGGTSPATLFFSSANNLSFVDIEFGNHRVFSDFYYPLHKRSDGFVKYIYQLKQAFPLFADTFPDINTYLENSYQELSEELKRDYKSCTVNSYQENFVPIQVGSENNSAEILRFVLRTTNFETQPNRQEDFAMLTSKNVAGITPLLLPVDSFSENLSYAGGEWQRNYHLKVPKYDSRPLIERTLPHFDHIKYPYLTISDFLEPYIVRLPYPVDTEKFFMGGYQKKPGQDEAGFALPLKRKYFEYFTIADLRGIVYDGKKRFEIQKLADGVVVTLRIPIQKNQYVTLSRIYSPNTKSDGIPPNKEKDNIGYILDHQVTLAIYPFVKTGSADNAHYRVMLAERDFKLINKGYNAGLKFYGEHEPTTSITAVTRVDRSSKQVAPGVSTAYFILESDFDFIELSHNAMVNILIPLFPPVEQPARVFKFAIDFGTTNTHIEYQVNGQSPVPFEIKDEVHVATLHEPGEKTEHFFSENTNALGLTISRLTACMQEEFLPFQITEGSDYKFPQRTVIYDNGKFSPVSATYALADFNIPFWYLKGSYGQVQNSNEVTANLKWADFGNDVKLEKRTRAFLKQIMLMLRNKVLINNGELAATEVVLFYPSSMPTFRRNFLEGAWRTFYNRYFPGGNGLYQVSESFAPFRYFAETGGVIALDRPATCIDIGGGTSDIVIYTNDNPQILTSFQFASNSLFGDGYGNTSATNGFVQKYEKIIRDSLTGTKAQNLTGVYDAVKQKNTRSVELIEFFFAIEENKNIIDNKIPLAFSKLLAKDSDFKVVFLLYYAAIIYHVASLMKLKGLRVPRYLTFSGNGSKVIGILAGGQDLTLLTAYTRIIFESVYDGVAYDGKLEIKLYPNPKELTCKGGLLITDYQQFNDLEERIREVLLGNEENTLIPETKITYQQLDNHILIDSVQRKVAAFIDQFFQWNDQFNYYNKFGISPSNFDRYKEVLKEDLKAFLIAGIKDKQRENKENAAVPLEETLFFYPLNGALNKLAYQIYTDNA